MAVAVEGDNGRWVSVAQVSADRDIVVFTSVLALFVPEPRRGRLAEFITRANFGLMLGAFQFDMDEGEVHFVTSVDFTGVDPTPYADSGALIGMIRRIVHVNVVNVDRYLPALMTVVYGDVDPAEAVATAEQD